VNSVAAPRSARRLHAEFLARVIEIEAVQCYREAVTEDHTAQFFAAGRRPGVFGDFMWSLDAPQAFPWGPIAPATSEEPAPVSLPMQHAWDAAVAAWAGFIAALVNGELIACGGHPAAGVRSEIHPAEWARSGLVLDVRNGDLIEGWYGRPPGKHTVLWSAITVRAAIPDPDTDFHAFAAQITGLDRKAAKNVNFAKIYGAGVRKFAVMIGKARSSLCHCATSSASR
jgi:hypothetical protein